MTLESLNAQHVSQQFMEQYSNHKESSFAQRRFKHSDLVPLIEKLPDKGFTVEEAGRSYQERPIYLISTGRGSKSVLLWSQMHGNEATATMALFDIFNYLAQADSESVQHLLDNLTLYFIPMLNPDGAELFQRRTTQNIDMNRDALRLQCPESQILKSIRDKVNPDFGFNLHDQNIYHSVGNTGKPATISFLAPAYNEQKQVNPQRENAMKVIVAMNQALQDIIPGQVGKYDDTFEPRAFGDNIQKWGTSTILIESGGFDGDPEKQFIRQLNFVAILTGLQSIAASGYVEKNTKEYWELPFNQDGLNDLIIRKVQFHDDEGKSYYSDIAIRREELDHQGNPPIYYHSTIEDLGDLSTQFGYQEINVEGLVFAPGKVYPQVLPNQQAVVDLGVRKLLSEGYTYIRVEQEQEQEKDELPFEFIGAETQAPTELNLNQQATFLLLKEDQIKYVVINGFVRMEKVDR